MGIGNSDVRILLGVRKSPSRTIPADSEKQVQTKTQPFEKSHPASERHRGYRACTEESTIAWSLLSFLYCTKKEWGLQGDPRSKVVERLDQNSTIQDGNTQVNTVSHTEGGLYGLHRPSRGLSACPNKGIPSAVSPLCLQPETFPIQGTSIWPEIVSQGVYENLSDTSSTPEIGGSLPGPIFGRYSSQGTFSRPLYGSGEAHSRMSTESRICDQRKEEHSLPNTNNCTLGRTNQYSSRQSFSNSGKTTKDTVHDRTGTEESKDGGNDIGTTAGPYGVMSGITPMGKVSHPSSTEVSSALSGGHCEQKDKTSLYSREPQNRFDLVAGTHKVPAGCSATGTKEGGDDHRCQPCGMGSSCARQNDSGKLVLQGHDTQHKLSGVTCHQAGSARLSESVSRMSCLGTDGQYDSKGIREPSGGDQIQIPPRGSLPSDTVVRRTTTVHQGDSRSGSGQCLGRLAQPQNTRPVGMDVKQGSVPTAMSEIRRSDHRPLCNSPKLSSAQFHGKNKSSTGYRSGCSKLRLASSTDVCLPSDPTAIQGDSEGHRTMGRSDPGSSVLAEETMVPRAQETVSSRAMAASVESRPSHSGGASASTTRILGPHSLEVERAQLSGIGYSKEVIDTLLASRKNSTTRVYNTTWQVFHSWCRQKGWEPLSVPISGILSFLQEGLSKGLSTSTLRRQVAAISAVRGARKGKSLSQHPHVKRFLKGAALINPPQVHRFPTWNLNLVLRALSREPFEPMATCPLKELTFKTVFLIGITSARRVSELRALSTHKELCVFHADKVVLRPDPAFVPKVNSTFHRSEDVVLPSFCPNPKHDKEREWHCLDVRRALSYYLDRTKHFRKSDALFVSFRKSNLGQRISTSTISRWIRGCIILAYKAKSEEPPQGVTAHSLRGAATSVAYRSFPSLETICKAATWKSVHSFTKHYRIDKMASADAAFGRRVLQHTL